MISDRDSATCFRVASRRIACIRHQPSHMYTHTETLKGARGIRKQKHITYMLCVLVGSMFVCVRVCARDRLRAPHSNCVIDCVRSVFVSPPHCLWKISTQPTSKHHIQMELPSFVHAHCYIREMEVSNLHNNIGMVATTAIHSMGRA